MYKLAAEQSVIRLTDNATIPVSDDNRDYLEYLAWLAEGNTPEPAETSGISDLRPQYISQVDDAAGVARTRFITNCPGQEMTYQEKVKQAEAFQSDDAPDDTKYPAIYAEVGVTAADAAGVASVFLQRYVAWRQMGARIEKLRLQAKADIGAAETEEAMKSIVSSIVWPQAET